MMSILLISRNQQKAIEHAKASFLSKGIHPLDITIIQIEQALGIEDIRTIQKKLFLMPLKSAEKALIISRVQTASVEAQNALLKMLEEPPSNTSLVLISESTKQLLPTILSRCNVQLLDDETIHISEGQLISLQKEFEEIEHASFGEKLVKAQKLTENKEQAIIWLSNIIILLRSHMIKQVNVHQSARKKIIELEHFQEAYTYATTTNVTIRMIFEQVFLQLGT